jgi:tRNA pseudouridine-54 N-methylase
MKWAILSGIEGNLAAYEAVLADIKRQSRSYEALYILGDLVEPTPESEKLVERVRKPFRGELEPLVCNHLILVSRSKFVHIVRSVSAVTN